MSERIYFEYQDDMSALHAELSAKHRHFVRFNNGGRPYYTDADFADIIAQESADYFEVFNNRWTADLFTKAPRIYRFNNGRIAEEWRGHDEWDYGYKSGGDWQALLYRDMATTTYAYWWSEPAAVLVGYGACDVTVNGDGFRLTTRGGLNVLREYIGRDSRGHCPHDLRKDFVIPAINEMRRQRLKGGYEPLVERIMASFDVHPTEVKEAPVSK